MMGMQTILQQITSRLQLNKLLNIAIFCACSMPMHFLHAQNAELIGQVLSSDKLELTRIFSQLIALFGIGAIPP